MDTAIGYTVIFQQTAQEGSWKMEWLSSRSFETEALEGDCAWDPVCCGQRGKKREKK